MIRSIGVGPWTFCSASNPVFSIPFDCFKTARRYRGILFGGALIALSISRRSFLVYFERKDDRCSKEASCDCNVCMRPRPSSADLFASCFTRGRTEGLCACDSLKMDKEKLEAERFRFFWGNAETQGGNSKSLIARLPAREWEGISGKNRAELHSARRERRRREGEGGCRLYPENEDARGRH